MKLLRAVIYGIIVGAIVWLIGGGLAVFNFDKAGDFIMGVSALVGLLAALWFYFFGADTPLMRR